MSSRKTDASGIYNREVYITARTKMCCEVCNLNYPLELLEFHHPFDTTKKFSLRSSSWRGLSGPPKKIVDEAEECVILCSNCHRLEHIALKRGETIINDQSAYRRYRNHRVTRYENLDDWFNERTKRGTKFSTTV